MNVTIKYRGLELKVSDEPEKKPIIVRGHFRVINGKKVYVRQHTRKR